MAKAPKRTKGQILINTIGWPLHALSPEVERLLLRISEGLREYYNWALETEHASNEAYEAARKAAPDVKPSGKRFLNEISSSS